MRYYKFISLGTFLVSISFSHILYVPECYSSVQQAIYSAKDDDTVSVNFGKVNGKLTTVTTLQIFNKAIIFEVRGEGKEKLEDFMRSLTVYSTPLSNNDTYPPPGWQGSRIINDTFYPYNCLPSISFNTNGSPWVAWRSFEGVPHYAKLLSWTRWTGSGWERQRFVEAEPDSYPKYKPHIEFDSRNIPFVIYNRDSFNYNDIFCNRYINNSWEDDIRINIFDSTDYDFSPMINCDGGEIWCAWYGGPNDIWGYQIYASRWNGTGWDPEIKISTNDNLHNWFCDIAIDNEGNPHIVWAALDTYPRPDYLFYRTHNGTHWLPVETIIQERLPEWTGSSIKVDVNGNVYVAWMRIVGNNYDIYFSKKINGIWLPPERINEDIVDDWYPILALNRNDDIWVFWGKEFSSLVADIFFSHYDGTSWTQEARLNRQDNYFHEVWGVDIDSHGYPWVTWGRLTLVGRDDCLYDRFSPIGIEEEEFINKKHTKNFVSLISKSNLFFNLVSYGLYDVKGCLVKKDLKSINRIPSGIYLLIPKDYKQKIKKIVIIK